MRKLLLGTALLLSACGGKVGEVARPKDITATTALNKSVTCTGEPKFAAPLVVDLDSSSRVNLEAAMKKGVVVVAFDCKSMRILKQCKVASGTYEYAGVSRKEDVVRMKNEDELSVNLPISAGKLSAEMKSGNAIELALVLVGQQSTAVEKVEREDMTGNCEGATHFLQSANVGAFSMATSSAGKVSGVADLFKASASGASSAAREGASSDGSLDACRKSDSTMTTPLEGCQSAISVELLPLSGVPKPKHADKPGEKKDPKKPTAEPELDPCPEGYVLGGGICTKTAEVAHLCKDKDSADCKVQCDKGNFESCYNYASGKAADPEEREAYYKKGCDGGVPNACGWYSLFKWDSDHPKSKGNSAAIEIAKKGCDAGGGESCTILGDLLWEKEEKGPFSDLPAAIKAYERSCKLGDGGGCSRAAVYYLEGKGVPKNEARGIELQTRACHGGFAWECPGLAQSLLKSDPERALREAQFGCKEEEMVCIEGARLAYKDLKKEAEAFAMLKSGCDRYDMTCESLGDFYEAGKGTPKDPAKAKDAWKKTCDAMTAANGAAVGAKDSSCLKAAGKFKKK